MTNLPPNYFKLRLLFFCFLGFYYLAQFGPFTPPILADHTKNKQGNWTGRCQQESFQGRKG